MVEIQLLVKILIHFGKNDFLGFKTDNLLSSLGINLLIIIWFVLMMLKRKGNSLEVKKKLWGN